MLRIGMDISQIAHRGGVAIYTKNLSQVLSNMSELEMIFFYSSFRVPYSGTLKNVKSYKLPPTICELFFNRIRNVAIERFIGTIDIFHSSDWTQPLSQAKKITTYHDVIPIKYPAWSHPKIVSVHKRRLKIIEEEIDAVIAVSENTKRDLLEVSRLPEEKITVVYEGPSADFQPQPDEKIKYFKKKYNLPDKFILAIGGVGERRNLARIKEACKEYNLVIAGQTIPWLDINELELLYSSAQVLAYCSLYEGFGIPILDAFSVGCPVVTSNTSSMPEVGGKAAIYANPFDIEDIKRKLREILEDKNLRKDSIEKGLEQIKKFSWKKCARETAKVYERAIREQ